MLLIIGFIVVMVALMIPILAIVLDSPFVRRLAETRGAGVLGAREADDLVKRLDVLEDEVADLGNAMRQLKDEAQFLQRLLEAAEEKSHKLPPPT